MHRLALVLAIVTALPLTADARPPRRPKQLTAEQQKTVAKCIHERTSPAAGLPADEAVKLCKLAVKNNARIERAIERARKAIAACEQAIVDACVDSAGSDGKTNCEDEDLAHAFVQCH